ncbi:MAG TPA: Dps family protein [Acidimicrobiia bacterium]|nr:Dps family protein [Acidimicrobiia bacterium]HMS25210.1 Dps family protein [Acidimicrobiia bacterium]
MSAETVNSGISEKNRDQVADGLAGVLADTYTLYLKTHNFHWNVTGPMFGSLHVLFETQYQELALAIDTLAERIRALGDFVPATFKQFQAMSDIKETEEIPKATEMIAQLLDGHEIVTRNAREVIEKADKLDDQATADLLTARLEAHEKAAWMLRSHLE